MQKYMNTYSIVKWAKFHSAQTVFHNFNPIIQSHKTEKFETAKNINEICGTIVHALLFYNAHRNA